MGRALIESREDPPDITAPENLSVEECAIRAKVSCRTVERWIRAGLLQSHLTFPHNRRRVCAADLNALLASPKASSNQ